MSRRLTPGAEDIREQIKQMIPETTRGGCDDLDKVDRLQSQDGRIMYGGSLLASKVSQLLRILKMGQVCFLGVSVFRRD